MTEPLVTAYVVHWLPGRLRLRIPEKRGDQRYFSALSQALQNRREVISVSANPFTGSVLLRLSAGVQLAEVAAGAKELSLFVLRKSSAPTRKGLATASLGLKGVDKFVARASEGYLDVKSGLFFALLLLAIHQTIKGRFAIPGGFTLLWYALTMTME
jgi:hypothetical protein